MGGLRSVASVLRTIARRLDPPSGTAVSTASATGQPIVSPSGVPPTYLVAGATTAEEARYRYEATREHDPFPEVPPALLNSAHIEDYMLATGMVFPYQRERRKSASYALRIGDALAYYDPEEPRNGTYMELKDRQSFKLKPNSLVYVRTKELFQLPHYVAVRFNLHIELVHKGLLLGTGPLVDPGFSGHLLIPLHNMTANEYVLAEDDEIIWVEFTKTSPNPLWLPEEDRLAMRGAPRAAFADFPPNKSDKRMEDYFKRARAPHWSQPQASPYPFPANAIPGSVEAARKLAASAQVQAENAAGSIRRLRNWGIGVTLGVGLAAISILCAAFFGTYQIVETTVGMADGSNGQVKALAAELVRTRQLVLTHAVAEARQFRDEYCAAVAAPSLRPGEAGRILRRTRLAEADANEQAVMIALPQPLRPLTAGPGDCVR